MMKDTEQLERKLSSLQPPDLAPLLRVEAPNNCLALRRALTS